MIALELSIEDRVGPALARFGDPRNQSRVLNFILARVGRRYRTFLKRSYLGGQMIDGGRGAESLSSRIVVYKDRRKKNVYKIGERGKKTANATGLRLANIYEHAGGYTIKPKARRALMFVTGDGFWIFSRKPIEGRARPFMSASFASFGWAATIDAEAGAVISKELAKGGLA